MVNDNYFPGWEAEIDGQKRARVYRANYTFMAVFVPRGEHQVRLVYQPQSFLVGSWISGVSFAILFLS